MVRVCLITIVVSLTWNSFAQNSLASDEIPVTQCTTTFVDRITFSSERPGVLREVPEAGDLIDADTIIVKLNDVVPQATLKVAQARANSEAAILAARTAWEAAKHEYDAAEEANRKASSSREPAFPGSHMQRLLKNVEAAKHQEQQAKDEKIVAEASVEQAEAELSTYHVKSHVSGVVTEVFKRRGEGVQQSEGIIQVVNTDRLRVEGNISLNDLFRVKVGMPVIARFTVPQSAGGPTLEYKGTLGFVDVSASSLAQNVKVWAHIDNSDGKLREGLEVQMVIAPNLVEPLPGFTVQ